MRKRFLFVSVLLLALMAFCASAYAAEVKKTYPDPITDEAIVLDSDRAILLGGCPSYKGVSVKERGFVYGLSPETLSGKALTRPIERDKMNVLVTGLAPQTVYYFRPFVRTRNTTYLGEIKTFTTPEAKVYTAQDAIFDNSDARYNFIFGTNTKYFKMNAPPWGYNGSREAAAHMVKITVKTWKASGKKRIPSEMTLYVHYKLAENVKAIFDEIFNLDIKFPIMSLSGFNYRRMVVPWVRNNPYLSQHSFGTCIDINKRYNLFYRRVDKRNKKSVYCIPDAVVQIFEKYGWTWGGKFKEGLDTMHFQYLGPELME